LILRASIIDVIRYFSNIIVMAQNGLVMLMYC